MKNKIKFSESIYSKDNYKEYHATIGHRKANQKICGMQSAGGRSTIRLKIWLPENNNNDYICEIECCPFSERICGKWQKKIHLYAENFNIALKKAKELSLSCMMTAIDLEIQHLNNIKKDMLHMTSQK